MKKINYLICLLFSFFFIEIVYANDIKSINMDIYIDNYGDAHITEIWDTYVNEGTEVYKPYYNLGESEIKDFTVSLNNTNYTTINNWDINASFDRKKYQAGLHEIDNGYELCFGISKYGNNTYTMKYTITNFVSSTSDTDMVYWTLIPYDLSEEPDYVKIKIYSDFRYSDTLDVWGYGNYGGLAYVYDGYIELVSEDGLSSDEYMTVLVKFPKDTFQTRVSLEHNFDYYYNLANEGATAYKKNSFLNIILKIFTTFVSLIPIIVAVIVTVVVSQKAKYGTKNLKFYKNAKKLKDVPYFRDLPCNKDIFKAYWVACQYDLIKKDTDFLGAILLKWLKNKNIENVVISNKNKEEVKIQNSKSAILEFKEEKAIKFISSDNLSLQEKLLFDMMVESSVDGILESYEFTKWCKKNYNKILKWFNQVIDNETDVFVNEGLIKVEKKVFSDAYIVDESMSKNAIEMAGLRKFLKDFSNIKDREAIEVVLWEEYLMYAQIFGIAKEVAKEFKKLYPDVITEDYYSDIIFIHSISAEGVSAASAARSRAESYSSGGGGFSSGGGGGGSFGGGGGGGGFR